MHFISYSDQIETTLKAIIEHKELHARWLNTLSFLENCGARKIAACEHPTLVKEEMLKHAAEEFRHAFYLKKQIARLGYAYEDYRLPSLLGGMAAYHYLNKLDIQTASYLLAQGVRRDEITAFSYLLVTYAIELRAAELYPLYDKLLKSHLSPIHVKSILLEEQEHLAEMERGLDAIPSARSFLLAICKLEATLFARWQRALAFDLKLPCI